MRAGSGRWVRRVGREFVRRVAPGYYWSALVRNRLANMPEPEIALLPILCRPDRAGFDVGASDGAYSVHMVGRVSRCVAFEPRSWSAEYLRQLARHAGLPIEVEEVALSNLEGRAQLRIPTEFQDFSTIEAANAFRSPELRGSRIVSAEVITRRLDSYAESTQVGFIKVDVEGHEAACLKGAETLLAEHRPRLIVEAEERHRPGAVQDLFDVMAAYEYAGFFTSEGRLYSVDEFNLDVHQNPINADGWARTQLPAPIYVNNFILIPGEESNEFGTEATKLL